MRMSPANCSFTRATSVATSALITVEFSQVASAEVSVVETTNLGMLFIFLPKSSAPMDGHACAKPWYVMRPSSCASAAISSSSLNLLPSSPVLYLNTQPASPGESMTPSTVMNSVTTSFPMMILRSVSILPHSIGASSCSWTTGAPESHRTLPNAGVDSVLGMQPACIGSCKHATRDCGDGCHDQRDDQGVDAAAVHNECGTDDGPNQHRGNGHETASGPGSLTSRDGAVRGEAGHGQREHCGGQVGHSEPARGGVLDAHGDGEDDDQRVFVRIRDRIAPDGGERHRTREEHRLN